MKFSLDQKLNSWEERNELVNLLAEYSNLLRSHNEKKDELSKVINRRIVSEEHYKESVECIKKKYNTLADNKAEKFFRVDIIVACLLYFAIPIIYAVLTPEFNMIPLIVLLVIFSILPLIVSVCILADDPDDYVKYIVGFSIFEVFISAIFAIFSNFTPLTCLVWSVILTAIMWILKIIMSEEYFLKQYMKTDAYMSEMQNAREKDKEAYRSYKVNALAQIERAKIELADAEKELNEIIHGENASLYQEFERHIRDIKKSEELCEAARVGANRLIAAFPKRLGTPRDLMEEASSEAWKKMWNDHEIRRAEAEAAMASAQAALDEFGRTFNRK